MDVDNMMDIDVDVDMEDTNQEEEEGSSSNNADTSNGYVYYEYYEEEDRPGALLPGINPAGHGTPCDLCKVPIYPDYGDFSLDNEVPCTLKCPTCKELTLVEMPFLGRKFTRCVCNRLLMYREDHPKVTCTRPTCRRVTIVQNPIPWPKMPAVKPMPTPMPGNVGTLNVGQDVVDQGSPMGFMGQGQGQAQASTMAMASFGPNNHQIPLSAGTGTMGQGQGQATPFPMGASAMGLITPLGANFVGQPSNQPQPGPSSSKRKLGGKGIEKTGWYDPNQEYFESEIKIASPKWIFTYNPERDGHKRDHEYADMFPPIVPAVVVPPPIPIPYGEDW